MKNLHPYTKHLLHITFILMILILSHIQLFAQDEVEVVEEKNVAKTLQRMNLLPERYEGKTMFFKGVELTSLYKRDNGMFGLSFKNSDRTNIESFSTGSNDIDFSTTRDLAIKIIDAKHGAFVKTEGV